MSQKSNSILGHRHGAVISELHVIAIKMSSKLTFDRSLLQNISLFYRALLQQRPIILKSLVIVATPYDQCAALAAAMLCA